MTHSDELREKVETVIGDHLENLGIDQKVGSKFALVANHLSHILMPVITTEVTAAQSDIAREIAKYSRAQLLNAAFSKCPICGELVVAELIDINQLPKTYSQGYTDGVHALAERVKRRLGFTPYNLYPGEMADYEDGEEASIIDQCISELTKGKEES